MHRIAFIHGDRGGAAGKQMKMSLAQAKKTLAMFQGLDMKKMAKGPKSQVYTTPGGDYTYGQAKNEMGRMRRIIKKMSPKGTVKGKGVGTKKGGKGL